MRVFVYLAALAWGISARGADLHRCALPEAQKALEEGMALQAELESESALASYQRCLRIEPGCAACRYESGWSHWKLGSWEEVVKAWEETLRAAPGHPDVPKYLPAARENLALLREKKLPESFVSGVALGTRSEPAGAPVSLLFLARRESYNPKPGDPMDQYDHDIHSPKSVGFAADGRKVYVNSLEAGRTVVYDSLGIEKKTVIPHKFGPEHAPLFGSVPWGYKFPRGVKKPNEFLGKPVEMELSLDGKFLFVPYYRRSFDEKGVMPSALAVIDTAKDEIARVIAVGPIAKYVKRSHRGRLLAVSHWGDNTVGLLDISSGKPERFRPAQLLVVEKRLELKNLSLDRDKDCGFCVRGLAFSEDDKYLFVTRMKGGGIAVFRLHGAGKPDYLGSVFGLAAGPRDLEVSGKGELFLSATASGVVAHLPWRKLVEALEEKETLRLPYEKRRVTVSPGALGMVKADVGLGARSFRLSRDESTLFVSVNQTSELIAVDTATMKVVARVPVDSYPVGLGLSPDGSQLWVTSQGRSSRGGNSVGIFQVRYKKREVVPLKNAH